MFRSLTNGLTAAAIAVIDTPVALFEMYYNFMQHP